jgi:hypothetical protein
MLSLVTSHEWGSGSTARIHSSGARTAGRPDLSACLTSAGFLTRLAAGNAAAIISAC